MKKHFLTTVFLLLTAAIAFGQNQNTSSAQCGALSDSQSCTFINGQGAGTINLEYKFSGSPSTVSIVVQGCMTGGTCDTLDTYTGTTNTNRHIDIGTNGPYPKYIITPSLSGGTSPKVTVNAYGTIARNSSGGSAAQGTQYQVQISDGGTPAKLAASTATADSFGNFTANSAAIGSGSNGSLSFGVNRWSGVVDTGAANVYAISVTPNSGGSAYAYTAGDMFCFAPTHSNTTTTPTLNVNSLGAKTIIKQNGSPLTSSDMLAGQYYCFKYDGTYFRIADPSKGLRVNPPTTASDLGWPGAIAQDTSGNLYAYKDANQLWYKYNYDNTFNTMAAPSFNPGAGTYGSTQSVVESCSGTSVKGCYTTNGATPTATVAGTCDQSTYSTPISVASSLTLKGICTDTGARGLTNSSVTSAAYTINSAPTYVATDKGFNTTAGVTSYQTTGIATTAGWNALVVVTVPAGLTISSVVNAGGDSFTEIPGCYKTDASAVATDCWYKTNITGNGADKVTITFSSTGQYSQAIVMYWQNGSRTLDVGTFGTSIFQNGGGTQTGPTFTTAVASELVVSCETNNNNAPTFSSVTIGGNAGTIFNSRTGVGGSIACAYYQASSTITSSTAVWSTTWTGSGWSRVGTVSFE